MARGLGDVALRWGWRSFPNRPDGFAVGHGGRKAFEVRVERGKREGENDGRPRDGDLERSKRLAQRR